MSKANPNHLRIVKSEKELKVGREKGLTPFDHAYEKFGCDCMVEPRVEKASEVEEREAEQKM